MSLIFPGPFLSGASMTETEARMIELLKELVLIPSTAGNPEHLAQAVDHVRRYVDTIPGVRVEDYLSDERPSLVAGPVGHDGYFDILLVGHVDVVEAEPEGFCPRLDGTRLYGRGAGDMKGQVAAIVELFTETLHLWPRASLGLMITSDEESGGRNGVGYLVNEKGYRAGTAIIPDSGSLNEIVVMEKGILSGRLVSKGRTGHSARPWESENAVHRLLENIGRMIEHFRKYEDGGSQWRHTFSANVLQTKNLTVNRVPDTAEAIVDIRFTEDMTADDAFALVKKLLDGQTEFHPEMVAEPVMTEPDPTFVRLTEQVTGEPVKLIREHGGSDARFFSRRKIPVIMSRPYVGGLHSDHEWIDIQSLLTFHQILAAYLREKFRDATT